MLIDKSCFSQMLLWSFHECFAYDDTMKYILMMSLVYDWNVQIPMGKILDVNFIDCLGMLTYEEILVDSHA